MSSEKASLKEQLTEEKFLKKFLHTHPHGWRHEDWVSFLSEAYKLEYAKLTEEEIGGILESEHKKHKDSSAVEHLQKRVTARKALKVPKAPLKLHKDTNLEKASSHDSALKELSELIKWAKQKDQDLTQREKIFLAKETENAQLLSDARNLREIRRELESKEKELKKEEQKVLHKLDEQDSLRKHLYQKEAEVVEQLKSLKQKQRETESREHDINVKFNELEKDLNTALKRDQEFLSRKEKLTKDEARLGEKARELAEREKSIAQKEKSIGPRELELEKEMAKIERYESMLAKRLKELKEETKEYEAKHNKRLSVLAKEHDEASGKLHELADREIKLTRLTTELEAKEKALENAVEGLERQEAQLAEAAHELGSKEKELSDYEAKLILNQEEFLKEARRLAPKMEKAERLEKNLDENRTLSEQIMKAKSELEAKEREMAKKASEHGKLAIVAEHLEDRKKKLDDKEQTLIRLKSEWDSKHEGRSRKIQLGESAEMRLAEVKAAEARVKEKLEQIVREQDELRKLQQKIEAGRGGDPMDLAKREHALEKSMRLHDEEKRAWQGRKQNMDVELTKLSNQKIILSERMKNMKPTQTVLVDNSERDNLILQKERRIEERRQELAKKERELIEREARVKNKELALRDRFAFR